MGMHLLFRAINFTVCMPILFSADYKVSLFPLFESRLFLDIKLANKLPRSTVPSLSFI